MDTHPSSTLAAFAANLRFEDIPAPVLRRAEDLLLDWVGSALAGKIGRPVQIIENFARKMGPADGACEVLMSRRRTSPYFAAMVNGASSHFAEQDDVHNGSVIHPAAVQAAGFGVFLRDAGDSKLFHTAKAAADGLLSAYLAADGFTGAKCILEGAQGMAAGMSSDADPAKLIDRLGQRWALAETSFKFHASCRHTHPAADALLRVMTEHDLRPEQVARVTAHAHQGAIDVLGPVVDPQTVHQAKFSMGTVLE